MLRTIRESRLLIALKLVAAVLLLTLAWSYRPAQAQGACDWDDEGTQIDAGCFTATECGDQTCRATEPATRWANTCTLVYLGGECVHYGCYGGMCDKLAN
jgi:hypothetical protein